MRIVDVAICLRKWIYIFFVWLKMSCNLPAMIYSNPTQEETVELDFGESKQPSVRRKTRLKREETETFSKWSLLPDILLEDIFSRLTIKERYYASQVCSNWNRIFYSKRVWNTFILEDKTLTRRKFNYYMGDQFVLDHHRTQLCLHKFARGIRNIIIKPMDNFFNLYEFMTILSYFCENYEQLNLIKTLDFTFSCELSPEITHGYGDKIFGTGGKLLQALKRLMDNLAGLKHLSLRDLLLEKVCKLAPSFKGGELGVKAGLELMGQLKQFCDGLVIATETWLHTMIPSPIDRSHVSFHCHLPQSFLFKLGATPLTPKMKKEEARYLLDDVAYNCCESLRTLKLVNCSKESFALLHPTVFVNLQSLTLSPQHLNDEIVVLLGNNRLKELYLLQTKLTPNCSPVSYKSWKECKKNSPYLNVHHIVEEEVKTQIVWQEGAPVKSVIYNNPDKEVCIASIYNLTNYYCNTLEVLAFTGIPEYSLHDSFEDRADTPLILLGKSCPYLDTIVIRDQISTATLILLAHYCRNLRRLVVRKYALIRKCDWNYNPEWTEPFYNWLRITSSSFESTFTEISNLLETKWLPLTDDEFKRFRI